MVTLDDDRFYWHVWLHSERVNGGLSEDWDAAQRAAAHACWQDIRHRRRPTGADG